MIFTKKINAICFGIFILLNICTYESYAFIIGNPSICFDSTEQTLEFGYQNSVHKVISKEYFPIGNNWYIGLSGDEVKISDNMFYLQSYKKIIDRILFLFFNVGASGDVLNSRSIGFGAQLSFPTDSFSVNFTKSWEWNTDVMEGARTDGIIAFWLSFPLKRKIFLYGGISNLQTTTHNPLDKNTGAFLGAKFLSKNNYDIAFELHSIKNSANILLGYGF